MKMESQTPRISVIVPVYNVEQYLPRCIDSILAQTFTDFELLLIDDGSKDKSGAICDAYARKDPRIRVFHKPNGGVSSARNMGLDNAKGEWICFCDSDDEFVKNTLESYFIITREDLDIDVISSGYIIYNKSGEVNVIKSQKMLLEDSEQKLFVSESCHYCGFLWNKCVKSDLAKQFRFDESISWLEDHLFMYSCILHSKKLYISENVLYKYYYNDNELKGHGIGLSNKMLDYNQVLEVAVRERNLKNMFIINDSGNLDVIINNSYKSKIRLAIYYAVMSGHPYAAFIINKKYLHDKYIEVLKYVLKPLIKYILKSRIRW